MLWCFFLFDILFFFLFNLSGAFLPVRVWAVQMEDKKNTFLLLFIGSAGRSSGLKHDLFISFSILQPVFTILYVFSTFEF